VTAALLVALGGAAGALLRHLAGVVATARTGSSRPGTLVVNLVACAGLGAVLGSGATGALVTAGLGAGVCGALSTWSTAAWETAELVEAGRRAVAVRYLLASCVLGTAVAALAYFGAAVLA